MKRFADVIVPFGLRIACRRATWPTRRSPCSVKATTDGVVREPSALGMTVGCPPSTVAITELVVPRSMPTALGMALSSPIALDGCLGAPGFGGTRTRLHPSDQPPHTGVDWHFYQSRCPPTPEDRCAPGASSARRTSVLKGIRTRWPTAGRPSVRDDQRDPEAVVLTSTV